MIAPLPPPETVTRRASRRLHEARDFVAATFLKAPSPDQGRPVRAWQAWAFVAWLVMVTVVFGLAMI